jgi:hypothetical protein
MREVRADLPSISLVISLSPSLLTGVSLSVSLSRHKHRAVDTRHHLLPPLHAGRVRGSPPTLVFGVVSSSSYISSSGASGSAGALPLLSVSRVLTKVQNKPLFSIDPARARPPSLPARPVSAQCCPEAVAAHFRMRSHMPPPFCHCRQPPSNPLSG